MPASRAPIFVVGCQRSGTTLELPRLRYPNKDEALARAPPPAARDVIEHAQRDDLRRLGHAV